MAAIGKTNKIKQNKTDEKRKREKGDEMGGSARKLRIRRGRPCVSAMIDKSAIVAFVLPTLLLLLLLFFLLCSAFVSCGWKGRTMIKGKAKWHNKRILLYLFYGIVASARRKVFLAIGGQRISRSLLQSPNPPF